MQSCAVLNDAKATKRQVITLVHENVLLCDERELQARMFELISGKNEADLLYLGERLRYFEV